MMVRNQFSQLLAPGAHAVFAEFVDTATRASEFEAVFNIESSTSAYEDDINFAGLGPMPEKGENESFIYQDLIQGGTKRYVHLTYGLGSRYSWELASDDKYGFVKKVPAALARSAAFSRQMVPWNVFNLGFSTILTADGVSLFNNQHPLLGGPPATSVGPGLTNVIAAAGTYPNRPSTDIDLSITALQLMGNHFERMIDSQGIPIMYKPKTLIIPPELKYIAREILGSDNKPYTTDNEINALKGDDLTFMLCHYLTSQSAWFALCDKKDHALKFFNRHPITQDFDDDFDTRALKQVAFQRFAAGATNWLGTWGSNGP